MPAILVAGVAWYASAARELYVLPAETVVGPERVWEACRSGHIAHLLVPEGVFHLPRRELPVEPVDIEKVFPLGAAEVPWEPDPVRWELAPEVPLLGGGWRFLFRERRAFAPWGDERDLPLLEAYRQAFGPRARFRESFDRRRIGLKYPQLEDPRRVYRLTERARSLPDPARYAPVMAVQDRLRLVDLEGGTVVTLEAGAFGWMARAFASAGDAAVGRQAAAVTPREPEELEAFLAERGRFWRLEPARRTAGLVLPH